MLYLDASHGVIECRVDCMRLGVCLNPPVALTETPSSRVSFSLFHLSVFERETFGS